MMEPINPPSLDEVAEIVERRRRSAHRRNQLAFTGVAAVVVAASGLGMRALVDRQGLNDAAGESGGVLPPDGGTPPATAVLPTIPDEPSEPTWTTLPPATVNADEAQAEYNRGAFFGAGFSVMQASELGEIWGIAQWEAKAKGGVAVLDGDRRELIELVGEPRHADAASFENLQVDGLTADDFLLGAIAGAGYTFEQMNELAAVWETPVGEAKAEAGFLALTGDLSIVEEAVGTPDGP
ncbi:MAG: hypothetical protein AAGD35_10435 [Actinomycetota bacterium]